MPDPKAKSKKPAAPSANGEPKELVYPDFEVHHLYGPDAIIEDKMKQFLGWQTEDEFIAERRKEHPEVPDATFKFKNFKIDDQGRTILDHRLCFEDCEGNLVTCWNIDKQRSFDRELSMKYAHIVLRRNWAGIVRKL